MAVRKLDKAEWATVFTLISNNLAGSRTEIDSLNLGSQIEAEWLPLVGITYDHKDDIVDVALEGSGRPIDHLIRQPQEIFIDETPTELAEPGNHRRRRRPADHPAARTAAAAAAGTAYRVSQWRAR